MLMLLIHTYTPCVDYSDILLLSYRWGYEDRDQGENPHTTQCTAAADNFFSGGGNYSLARPRKGT